MSHPNTLRSPMFLALAGAMALVVPAQALVVDTEPLNNSQLTADMLTQLLPGTAVSNLAGLGGAGGDVDFFQTPLAAGEVLFGMVTPLAGLPTGFTAPDTIVGVFDDSREWTFIDDDDAGELSDNGYGYGSLFRLEAPDAADYRIGVSGCCDFAFDGAASHFSHVESGGYALTAARVDPAIPGGGFADTDPANQSAVGADLISLNPGEARVAVVQLTDGDVDFFRLELQAGDALSAMTAPLNDLGVSFDRPDTMVGLFDSSETNLLVENDNAGGKEFILFGNIITGEIDVSPDLAADFPYNDGLRFGSGLRALIPADGTYYLAVTGTEDYEFTGAHAEIGDYALLVGLAPVPEPDSAMLAVIGFVIACVLRWAAPAWRQSNRPRPETISCSMNRTRCAAFIGCLALATSARADIYRWDTGQVIPGTEGITPGPGVELDHRQLEYAALYELDLTDSRFDFANLANAYLFSSTLTNANLSGANLANANLYSSTLTNADMSGAVVTGAGFSDTTSRGFTKEQLYSTAGYPQKNLQGIGLYGNDLSGWDFNGQNLANASLLSSTLTNADLSGAVVTGASFSDTTSRGFTKEQLYSTASYQQKNLQGIGLYFNDLSGWDFNGQNLANAYLNQSTHTNADLSGAVVTGANFYDTTSRGFTKEQLYSTASYQQKNLQGIHLGRNDLSGWDFNGQNLANALLYSSTLTNADLSGANLANANLGYSTLTNANLSGANLANAFLFSSTLTNADLSFADTRGAYTLLLAGTTSRNAIRWVGTIAGLNLAAGDQLIVRNYHGDPNLSIGPIPITVQDQMTMAAGGVLQLLFDADPWDSLISFEPGILVELGGTLELTFADDVDVTTQVGRTLRVFDWTGVEPTGAFTVSSLYPWDVSELYTTGEVTLLLPGDTNGDQTVDLADLNNVRNQFGLGGEGLAGDTNADEVVDLADLNNVRNFFGVTTLAQPVPEPTTWRLALAVLLGLVALTTRRQRREF